jgi:hypothetical protein
MSFASRRLSDGLRPLGSWPILGVCGIHLRLSANPCVVQTAFGLWALLAPRPRLHTRATSGVEG